MHPHLQGVLTNATFLLLPWKLTGEGTEFGVISPESSAQASRTLSRPIGSRTSAQLPQEGPAEPPAPWALRFTSEDGTPGSRHRKSPPGGEGPALTLRGEACQAPVFVLRGSAALFP